MGNVMKSEPRGFEKEEKFDTIARNFDITTTRFFTHHSFILTHMFLSGVWHST